MKLQRKLTVFFAICLTAIFSIAAVIISIRINYTNSRLTENLSTQLIESKANEAGAWLAQRIRELHTISRTPTVVSMDDEAIKAYINQLSNDMDSYYGNNYGTFSINKLDGLEYINENQTIDVSDREYFKRILNSDDEYVISEPIVSKTDQSLITVACYPIYNTSSEKIGFVAAAISLRKLTEITDNLSFYNGKSMIVDSSGTIYTHTDEGLSESLIQDIIAHIPKNSDGTLTSERMSEENKGYVAFYAPIPNSHDWYLCTSVEKAELYKDTRILNESLISMWILLLLVAISVSYFVSNAATKRIAVLSSAMENVRKGNLETKITLPGNDELSNLADDFNAMVVDIKELMNQSYEHQKEKRQRELQVLQSQINLHFLYNTLDTLQWKALEYGAHEMADLIMSLSSFFRISLSKGREFITLEKELEHVKSYLSIQQHRYGDILNYEISCDKGLYKLCLPKILIQPLVENAIYHGIKPSLKRGNISINIFEEHDNLNIVVEDDGVGIPEEKLTNIRDNLHRHLTSSNYGLYNVSQRIYLHYGDKYGLNIESRESAGTKITVSLPKIEEDEVSV
ncbi:sensor histidine kinase [Sedimentibacter saalensis]|uniref:histidine kinase n=1 Tax=Sedimentibacter saalensis TaxID=130788 RepID=A0A562JEP5_9FIRM|nr:sensor histidine kinase [Sedimentibacter saalensis]TWH81796.1 two-component system sensor histidine kinase YesM [Sedimentibacter saalensis]